MTTRTISSPPAAAAASPAPAPTTAPPPRHASGLPWWLTGLLIPLLQLALALGVASLVVLLVGESPLDALRTMLVGALDPTYGLASTLYYATSLTFTGLAVAVAFHAGLFNIGGEGQAYFAGLGVALACLWLDGRLGAPAMFAVAVLAATAAGALWAWIPGYLQARRGAHVVVTTIMFNYIATGLLNYMLVSAIGSGGMSTETRGFAPQALLPKLHEALAPLGIALQPSFLNIATPLALLCAAAVWWLLWRTRLGYALRLLGQSPRAARYAGLSAASLTITAMLISGALAGLMAVNDVYGGQGRLVLNFTGGMGFLGIAVALMGRNHPLGVLAAALLFGALCQGATDLQLDFPRISPELLLLIQGLVVFFVAALDRLVRAPLERRYLAHAARPLPQA
ncbi:MAG: ABC transporter permease [Comamonas sp.]